MRCDIFLNFMLGNADKLETLGFCTGLLAHLQDQSQFVTVGIVCVAGVLRCCLGFSFYKTVTVVIIGS